MAMNCMQVWKWALSRTIDKGEHKYDVDGRGTREVMNLIIDVNDLEDVKSPIDTLKKKKDWSYPSFEELEDIILKKYSSIAHHYTYGARIFNHGTKKNQVDDFIIPLLKSDPASRKAIITIYNPSIDSHPGCKESPSLLSVHFRISGGRLCLSATFRSSDMFMGWPANIYQLYTLQGHVCGKLGLKRGSITTISHCAHVFEDDTELVLKLLNK